MAGLGSSSAREAPLETVLFLNGMRRSSALALKQVSTMADVCRVPKQELRAKFKTSDELL
jgi:hypothetical protein